jgi:hypothetical protein
MATLPIRKKAAPARKAAPAKKATALRASSHRDDSDHSTAPRSVTSGWAGADELGGGDDFIKRLDFKHANKIGDTMYFVVKFLDDGPYANLRIHWVDRKGKRSFVCIGDDCPLCEIGSSTKSEYRFNVAILTESEPMLRSMNAGYKLYRKIRAKAENPLSKPLPRHFFVASRSGSQWHEIQYDIEKITSTEISEAYPDLYVPSADEIAAITPYTLDDIEKEYSSIKEMTEVAAEVVENEG